MFELIEKHPDLYPPEKGYSKEALCFAAPEQLPELSMLMTQHGYTKQDINNIMGENYW